MGTYTLALNDRDATGRELVFVLRGRGATENVRVHLHFAVYDQVPVIRKWMEVENGSGRRLTLDKFQLEYLAMAEPNRLPTAIPTTSCCRIFMWRVIMPAAVLSPSARPISPKSG